MSTIPPAAKEAIWERSEEVRALHRKAVEAQRQVDAVRAELQQLPGSGVDESLQEDLLLAIHAGEREVEVASAAMDEEIDYQYRLDILQNCRVPEITVDDRYVSWLLTLDGPAGETHFNIEGTGGRELTAYLGKPNRPLSNRRPTLDQGALFASKPVDDPVWNGAVDVLSQTLWEAHRRSRVGQEEWERKQRYPSAAAATWTELGIDFLSLQFVRHLQHVDRCQPCPRCAQALIPLDPNRGFVYCRHCAQGYELAASDISAGNQRIGVRPLHYDCPGCGLLIGIPTYRSRLGDTCTLCGVNASVSVRGEAAYSDKAVERKDRGSGLFADKKRAQNLAKWKATTSGRADAARVGLDERYAQWEADLRTAVERLWREDQFTWRLHSAALMSLTRYRFTPPDDETLNALESQYVRERQDALEKELTAKYPFGLPYDVGMELKAQYPWARYLLERLGSR